MWKGLWGGSRDRCGLRSRISSEGLSAVVSGRSQPVLAFVVNRNNYRSTYTVRVKSTPFITKYLSSFANLYRNLCLYLCLIYVFTTSLAQLPVRWDLSECRNRFLARFVIFILFPYNF